MDMGSGSDLFPDISINRPAPATSGYLTIQQPFRTIPCSAMSDDFYSNLMDWSDDRIFYCENNVIYEHCFSKNLRSVLFDDPSLTVCSIKAMKQSPVLSLGCASGAVVFLDLGSLKSTRLAIHKGRVSTLEVYGNNIITGSRDRRTCLIDPRTRMAERSYAHHTQEVCGISTNNDGRYMCTGGNDNKIFVVDFRRDSTHMLKLEDHKAAVKALCWSPQHGTKFVSGGGTADKTIKHWDIQDKTPLQRSAGFESQVCNLRWLQNNKILSTFGYSNDDIKLLKDFRVERKYNGHRNRVIHFAVNTSEEFFASGSGDSDIKIWQIEDDEKDLLFR